MFGNKNKKNNTNDEELLTKVNQDMIVRNMPSLARVSGSIPQASTSSQSGELTQSNNLSSLAPAKHNFKMVGVLIIFNKKYSNQ